MHTRPPPRIILAAAASRMKQSAALLLLLIAASPAAAQSELRYASHMEVHPGEGAPASGLRPVPPANGAQPTPNLVDSVTVIGDHARRTESGHPEEGVLAGSISIQRGNTLIFLNAVNKTFATETVTPPGPDVLNRKSAAYTRTGEFATIAGVRAERVSFAIVITVNVPGQPSRDFESTGDLWLSDRFKEYASNIAGAGPPGMSLYDSESIPQGFPMKSAIRGGYFGPNEIQMTVTSIAEEPLQPALFAPPDDYREVPMPQLFRASDAR